MSRSHSFRAAAVLVLCSASAAAWAADAPAWADIGRAATPAEVKVWDIDVRPDFQGLPAGSGTVERGQELWESTCATCHGVFGESNSTFSPLIGGTSDEDVKAGRVADLKASAGYPGATTFMKVPTISTVWDYIHRAMPWNNPKSLSADDVYAVTAYLLNLAYVLPDDFTLSDKNIAEVQGMMPNRDGVTTDHALWPGDEFGHGDVKPDTHAKACMEDCATEVKITSEMPDSARDAWGNLREQNRTVGPQRGADTSRPEGKLGDATGAVKVVGPTGSEGDGNAPVLALLQESGCMACHAVDRKVIGPAFQDVAEKYAGKADYLEGKIKSGGSGVWGDAAMPPQDLAEADLKTIAGWLAAGAPH